jgi:SAM-dependent methyltransferase
MANSLTVLRRSIARLLDPEPAPATETAVPPVPAAEPAKQPADVLIDWRYYRAQLAERYIRGAGIEFGALHFPLPVPPGTVVTYADYAGAHLFNFTGTLEAPAIVSDLETMKGFDADSQDFVIANHVIEHVEDPLKALRAMSRVLRSNGIIYLAIPDKRFTFDKDRAVTTLDHLLRDHAEGPDWSLAGHYDEWVRVVDGLTGTAHAEKLALMLKQRANIHFHAWDFAAMMELFAHVERDESFGLFVENAQLNPIEAVWILRKR